MMLLLTDQRRKPSRLWEGLDMNSAKDLVESYRRAFPAMTSIWDEVIDFEPRYRDETVYYVDSAGRVVEERTFRQPINRRLAPFVKPLEGSPTGRHLADPETVYTFKMTNTVPEFEIIDLERVDFSQIERHVIGVRHAMDAVTLVALGATNAFQDFTRNAVFGEPYQPKIVAKEPATKQNGRSAAYLQHDKTKSHKRRRK